MLNSRRRRVRAVRMIVFGSATVWGQGARVAITLQAAFAK